MESRRKAFFRSIGIEDYDHSDCNLVLSKFTEISTCYKCQSMLTTENVSADQLHYFGKKANKHTCIACQSSWYNAETLPKCGSCNKVLYWYHKDEEHCPHCGHDITQNGLIFIDAKPIIVDATDTTKFYSQEQHLPFSQTQEQHLPLEENQPMMYQKPKKRCCCVVM